MDNPKVDDISSDPTINTTNTFTSNAAVLILPGSPQPVFLGTGFRSDLAKAKRDPWVISASPFTHETRPKIKYTNHITQGSYLETSNSHSCASADHLSVGFGIGIGNDYVGASVTGRYDKHVMSNRDASKFSLRSSCRVGAVMLEDSQLTLSAKAKDKIRRSRSLKPFFETYGDYYVAEVRLGGDTQVMVSTSASRDAKSEKARIIVEAHFLCFSGSKESTIAEAEIDVSSTVASLNAYDTLDNTSHLLSGVPNLSAAANEAAKFLKLARDLTKRVDARVEVLKLVPGGEYSADLAAEVFDAGLVAEVVLVPFCVHREVLACLFDLT